MIVYQKVIKSKEGSELMDWRLLITIGVSLGIAGVVWFWGEQGKISTQNKKVTDSLANFFDHSDSD